MSDWKKSADNKRIYKKKDCMTCVQVDNPLSKKNKTKTKHKGSEKVYREFSDFNEDEEEEEEIPNINVPKIKPQPPKPDFDKWMLQQDED